MQEHMQMDFASPLPHPGEILREDFMEPLNLTAGALARAMGLKDRTRIERLSREKQPVTADTAARLARVFGNSAQFWMNLQSQHDLSVVEIEAREDLGRIEILPQASDRGDVADIVTVAASSTIIGQVKHAGRSAKALQRINAARVPRGPADKIPLAGAFERKPPQKTPKR
jgi:addiction module HigA family antidote